MQFPEDIAKKGSSESLAQQFRGKMSVPIVFAAATTICKYQEECTAFLCTVQLFDKWLLRNFYSAISSPSQNSTGASDTFKGELLRTFGTHHPHTVVRDFSISFRKPNWLSELLEILCYSQVYQPLMTQLRDK